MKAPWLILIIFYIIVEFTKIILLKFFYDIKDKINLKIDR